MGKLELVLGLFVFNKLELSEKCLQTRYRGCSQSLDHLRSTPIYFTSFLIFFRLHDFNNDQRLDGNELFVALRESSANEGTSDNNGMELEAQIAGLITD